MGKFPTVGFALLLSLTTLSAGAQPPGPETAPGRSPETRPTQAQVLQQPKAVKTSLEMKVRGVLAIGEGDDRRSSAIIAMKGAGKAYSPGQVIDDNPDLKLVKIQDDRIEFLNKGQLEFAPVNRFPDAGYGGGGGAASSPPPASAANTKTREPLDPTRPTTPRPRPARRTPGAPGEAITPAADGQTPEQ